MKNVVRRFVVLGVALSVVACSGGLGNPTAPDVNVVSVESDSFRLVNQERIGTKGVSQVGLENRIAGLARQYAARMRDEGFFSHIAPDGATLKQRLRSAGIGFKSAAVFGYSQTEGDPLPEADPEATRWLESLPLRDVAESWGLSIESYNGHQRGPQGKYRPGQGIALGVENLSTWAHELLHAADDRLGNLTERGQHWRSETVAELGGAILLEALGLEHDADRGGCWEYVRNYAESAGIEPITACQRCLKRTCDAVALVLDTAEALAVPAGEAVAVA